MAFPSICGFSGALSCEAGCYALRGCSRALLAGSKGALASCSQVAAGGDRWLVMRFGASRGHAALAPELAGQRPKGSWVPVHEKSNGETILANESGPKAGVEGVVEDVKGRAKEAAGP